MKAAEADAEAKFLAGQGIARQRQVRAARLHASPRLPAAPPRPQGRRPAKPATWEQQPCWLAAWQRARSQRHTPAASYPSLQAIIAGLRESVQTFATEVTDVNSRDVMELLVRGQGWLCVRRGGWCGWDVCVRRGRRKRWGGGGGQRASGGEAAGAGYNSDCGLLGWDGAGCRGSHRAASRELEPSQQAGAGLSGRVSVGCAASTAAGLTTPAASLCFSPAAAHHSVLRHPEGHRPERQEQHRVHVSSLRLRTGAAARSAGSRHLLCSPTTKLELHPASEP